MTQRAPVYTRIAPRAHPVELLTWARGVQLGIQPTPFIQRQSEWPNPVLARPNHELRGWVNGLPPGVVGNPVPPIRNRDWPNPTLRVQNHELRTWLHAQQITPPIVLPFGQTDWPNPRAYPRNQDVLTWVEGLPQTALALTLPQRQTEWPNPVLAQPPNIALRSWTNGLPAGQLALTLPPVQLDWPNPPPARANLELRTWAFALQQQPAVQSAFGQFDWPNPSPLRANLELRSWTFTDSAALLSVVFVTVPNVVGETDTQATTDIAAQGLITSITTAYSATIALGIVISQDPAGGASVGSGSIVTILVSLGPQPIIPDSGASGGFLYAYELERTHRARKKREREELEEDARTIQDRIDREIAELLHRQEAEDDRRAELSRLQRLVQDHAKSALDLSDRAKIAYVRALTQANFSAMEALDRELQRQLEEEEITALMILLNDD